ncbi:MAG: hypothetical protein IPN50_10120 [Sphingomonadales bacterium]|nr:hypothetical protein [Sphingomonadales bacterium]
MATEVKKLISTQHGWRRDFCFWDGTLRADFHIIDFISFVSDFLGPDNKGQNKSKRISELTWGKVKELRNDSSRSPSSINTIIARFRSWVALEGSFARIFNFSIVGFLYSSFNAGKFENYFP